MAAAHSAGRMVEAFIMQALCIGEEFGIYCGVADGASDLVQGFDDGIEKGATGILHQMPAVGTWSAWGRALAIASP
jgi:hypothetical protein